MGRRLRWRTFLSRLALLAGLLVAGQLVVAHAIRRAVIRSGERSVGARVEVGTARLSLTRQQVSLRDVRIANPLAPLRNLVEADRCELTLRTSPLLHKRIVVEGGAVSGLRFGTPRESSGALSTVDPVKPVLVGLDEHSVEVARDWLNRLQLQFNHDFVDELESTRLTEDLVQRWPGEAAAIEKRATAVRERTKEFQKQVRRAQANPLRHAEFVESIPDEIAAIERAIDNLARELEALPELIESQRRAIVAARRHDAELLRARLPGDRIDASALTAYLLEQQLAGPVSDLLGWLRWARQLVPAAAAQVAANGSRGRKVLFDGCLPAPDVLVRSLELQGVARLGSQSIEFTGSLCDASSHPARHDQPLQLRLSAKKPVPVQLLATIDRTGPVARDQLLVDCGGIVIPQLQLGTTDALRFSIAPTTASLSVSITFEGDRLVGDIQLVQQQAEITSSVGPELARLPLSAALNDVLRRRQAVATRVSLGGTLDEPTWRVWSNLGPTVAEAVDRALKQAADTHAHQLFAESQRRIDEQLARLDRQSAEQQASLLPQLTDTHAALDELAAGYDRSGQLSLEYLGRRLPANSLFR